MLINHSLQLNSWEKSHLEFLPIAVWHHSGSEDLLSTQSYLSSKQRKMDSIDTSSRCKKPNRVVSLLGAATEVIYRLGEWIHESIKQSIAFVQMWIDWFGSFRFLEVDVFSLIFDSSQPRSETRIGTKTSWPQPWMRLPPCLLEAAVYQSPKNGSRFVVVSRNRWGCP